MLPRPKLDLGAMAASSMEENQERMASLVDIFNTMLQKRIELRDSGPEGGATDCATFIRVPFADDEAYLICEHELSHFLGETDIALTRAVVEATVEKLLTRAKIPLTAPLAAQYRPTLYNVVFHLCNVLDDYRCCSVWGELYFGGATLLLRRWKSILEHRTGAEADFMLFLGRVAAGVPTPNAPPMFQVCAPHMADAIRKVQLVDSSACLAVASRLVDAIMDELLSQFPPPNFNPLNKSQTAQQKLDLLQKAAKGANTNPQPPSLQGPGTPDVEPSSDAEKVSARRMRKIRSLSTADDAEFSALCIAGAQAMAIRIEEAKKALGLLRENEQQKAQRRINQFSEETGIRIVAVSPERSVGKASPRAGRARQYLDMVRMEVSQSFTMSGNRTSIQRSIASRISGDRKIRRFIKKTETGGLHLLLLCDVSGSMYGPGLEMVEQAIADVAHICTDMNVKVALWAFSSELYIFSSLGSLMAPGVWMGCTHTVQALDVAARWLREERGSRAVMLLTDGYPTTVRKERSTGTPLGDLKAVIRELRDDQVIIATLGVGGQRDNFEDMLRGTLFGHAASIQDIPQALTDAIRGIVEQHLRLSQ